MSELCLSNNFSSLLLSDFIQICSFILTHPLYFSYFIFFSPYLLKLLSFLSPLFITTSLLLLLIILTVSPGLIHDAISTQLSEPKLGFFHSAYHAVTHRLDSKSDDQFEEFEAYRIMFGTSLFDVENNPIEVSKLESQDKNVEGFLTDLDKFDRKTETLPWEEERELQLQSNFTLAKFVEDNPVEVSKPQSEDKNVDGFLNDLDEFVGEGKTAPLVANYSEVEDLKKNPLPWEEERELQSQRNFTGAKIVEDNPIEVSKLESRDKIVQGFLKVLDEFDNVGERKAEPKKKPLPLEERDSKISSGAKIVDDGGSIFDVEVSKIESREKIVDGFLKVLDEFENATLSLNVGERKTEAKKDPLPLEERTQLESQGNSGGGDGCVPRVVESSDLGSYGSMRKEKEWRRTLACKLFEERHNVDGMDSLWETYELGSGSMKAKPKAINKNRGEKSSRIEENEDEDEDEDDFGDSNGRLCCLQALKFSAGKVNLGMGKPNLQRISKAIKGFGWLHHVSSRHGKKKKNAQ